MFKALKAVWKAAPDDESQPQQQAQGYQSTPVPSKAISLSQDLAPRQIPEASDPPSIRKILSLDGGGVRGLSDIMILECLMNQLGHKRGFPRGKNIDPWQEFDMIVGTSTGGLLLSCSMSVRQCEDAYLKLSNANVFGRTYDFLQANGRFQSEPLEDSIREMLEEHGLPKNELLWEQDPEDTSCKVVVCAVQENGTPRRIRSYDNADEFDNLLDECQIWQAARATSAASTFFEPITIGRHGRKFVDGALIDNNPIEVADDESRAMFPNQDRMIVSFGTGVQPPSEVTGNALQTVKTLVKLVTDTEHRNEMFHRQHRQMIEQGRLYRFNVTQGLGTLGLEEHTNKSKIAEFTDGYLLDPVVMRSVQACASVMREGGQRLHYVGGNDLLICLEKLRASVVFAALCGYCRQGLFGVHHQPKSWTPVVLPGKVAATPAAAPAAAAISEPASCKVFKLSELDLGPRFSLETLAPELNLNTDNVSSVPDNLSPGSPDSASSASIWSSWDDASSRSTISSYSSSADEFTQRSNMIDGFWTTSASTKNMPTPDNSKVSTGTTDAIRLQGRSGSKDSFAIHVDDQNLGQQSTCSSSSTDVLETHKINYNALKTQNLLLTEELGRLKIEGPASIETEECTSMSSRQEGQVRSLQKRLKVLFKENRALKRENKKTANYRRLAELLRSQSRPWEANVALMNGALTAKDDTIKHVTATSQSILALAHEGLGSLPLKEVDENTHKMMIRLEILLCAIDERLHEMSEFQTAEVTQAVNEMVKLEKARHMSNSCAHALLKRSYAVIASREMLLESHGISCEDVPLLPLRGFEISAERVSEYEQFLFSYGGYPGEEIHGRSQDQRDHQSSEEPEHENAAKQGHEEPQQREQHQGPQCEQKQHEVKQEECEDEDDFELPDFDEYRNDVPEGVLIDFS
ncbi:MAG: hypothetical protein M1828_004034 [Chrysothrix sp. TS-e1954]|nr:MAG: hypothetical protein M1828_004034 [Chrysothrix sp. TS-e1954]